MEGHNTGQGSDASLQPWPLLAEGAAGSGDILLLSTKVTQVNGVPHRTEWRAVGKLMSALATAALSHNVIPSPLGLQFEERGLWGLLEIPPFLQSPAKASKNR